MRRGPSVPPLPGAQDDFDPEIPADATLVQVPADRDRLFAGEAYGPPPDGFGAMGAEDGTIMQAPNPMAFAAPAPAAGRPAMPMTPMTPMAPLGPPAPSSDRVLLPPKAPDQARAAAPGSAPIPAWVTVYVFVALLLAVAGAVILFVEARILGHF